MKFLNKKNWQKHLKQIRKSPARRLAVGLGLFSVLFGAGAAIALHKREALVISAVESVPHPEPKLEAPVITAHPARGKAMAHKVVHVKAKDAHAKGHHQHNASAKKHARPALAKKAHKVKSVGHAKKLKKREKVSQVKKKKRPVVQAAR